MDKANIKLVVDAVFAVLEAATAKNPLLALAVRVLHELALKKLNAVVAELPKGFVVVGKRK